VPLRLHHQQASPWANAAALMANTNANANSPWWQRPGANAALTIASIM